MSRANPASAESSRGVASREPTSSPAATPRITRSTPVADTASRRTRSDTDGAMQPILRVLGYAPRGGIPAPRDPTTRGHQVAKERYEDRQRKKAAAREAGEHKARRASLIWRAVGVVVIVIAIAVSYSFVSRSRLLQRVTTATYRAGMHVAGPIAYTEKPPMGGTHNVVWQNCGVYEAPIHSEHAVHALEHGAV